MTKTTIYPDSLFLAGRQLNHCVHNMLYICMCVCVCVGVCVRACVWVCVCVCIYIVTVIIIIFSPEGRVIPQEFKKLRDNFFVLG